MVWEGLTILAVSLVAFSAKALAASLLASHFSGTVYTLELKLSPCATTGNLSITSSIEGCGLVPSWLTFDSKTSTLYCFDEDNNGTGVVTSYSVAKSGHLTISGSAPTTGGDVHGWLYGDPMVGASYPWPNSDLQSTISTYKLPLTSSDKLLQKIQFTMDGPGPNTTRQDAPHPHATFTDPTGNFLVVPDLGADLVRIFSIDADSGHLTACPPAAARPADGPRHGAWWAPAASSAKTHAASSNIPGLMLYVVNELTNTISTWQVTYPETLVTANGTAGCMSLKRTQTLSNFPPGQTAPGGTKSAEVHVFGNDLYVSNRDDRTFGDQIDSLAHFSIDPSSGALTFVELTSAYGWYPRTFSINRDGTLLAVGGQTSSNVAIIRRNATTGALGPLVANVSVATRGTDGGEDGLSGIVWNE